MQKKKKMLKQQTNGIPFHGKVEAEWRSDAIKT